jgi:hypothetical protein
VKLAVKHASCLTPCRQDFSSHPSQIVWNYLNTDLSNECGTRFDMPAPTVTPEIKKELQLLQLRGVMDPKRHYKASDMKGIPKYFQIGTVVEGGADFYSGRLTKKERKGTFADELLADTSLKAYRKRKYKEIQEEKQAGGKKFWKQKKNRQKPSWAKT